MNKILLATSNLGKVREIQAALNDLKLEIIPQNKYGVSNIAEMGSTFVENALLKARHGTASTHLPTLADDSGLVVPALNGEPGIYSARYAGEKATDADNNHKLLQRMDNIKDRRAHFYCVLVFMRHEKDPEPIICEGRWHGEILFAPRGIEGFGYNPVFYVPSQQCSAAELSLEQKNSMSHRGIALNLLKKQLQLWLQA